MKKCPRPNDINPIILYGAGEAADLLGITRRTIDRKAKLGRAKGGLASIIDKGTNYRKFKGRELLRYLGA